MATKEERDQAWRHLIQADTEEFKTLTQKMTADQRKTLTFNYILSHVFTELDYDPDGQLKMLDCQIDIANHRITTFDQTKYKMVFQRVEDE